MALRIGVDVDGVLADFRSSFHAAAIRVLRRDVDTTNDSPQNPGALAPQDVRRVWDYIGKTQNWWMEVEAYEPEQIARLYSLTRAAGSEVFFLTKRPPTSGDSVQFQTQWWIERLGFYLPAVLTVPGSRGDIANGLRLDLILDDQMINCVEVVSATPTKALLMQRTPDNAAREHAINRGIGVVSTLAEAVSMIERLHDVLPQKRGRMVRLSEWFSGTTEVQTLPQNPRTVRPIPPFEDPRR
ncbi:MAG: hypothetical protein DMF84_03285 [Acidobacteria bacterium]|nr:MAG: hypothetical protein DMF84_03285 [Acidobacteriota bacterium]